ncbi:MAG: endonuclease domain-containing protein [Dehalococcoidia bacterium]
MSNSRRIVGEIRTLNDMSKGVQGKGRKPTRAIRAVLQPRARTMRHEPTEAEAALCTVLPNRQMGFKFKRQELLGTYIVDFYCAERRLAIEVDGPIHADLRAEDQLRDSFLTSQGVREVLRFGNSDVLEPRIDTVVESIHSALELAPLSPWQGERAGSEVENSAAPIDATIPRQTWSGSGIAADSSE